MLQDRGKTNFMDREIRSLDNPHDVLEQISYVGVYGSDVSWLKYATAHSILTNIG